MKRKLLFILIAAFTFFSFPAMIQAQGLYKQQQKEQKEESGKLGEGSILRADPPGGGPTTEPGNPSPVGEGLLILSFLAGGYAIFKKKNVKNK